MRNILSNFLDLLFKFIEPSKLFVTLIALLILSYIASFVIGQWIVISVLVLCQVVMLTSEYLYTVEEIERLDNED